MIPEVVNEMRKKCIRNMYFASLPGVFKGWLQIILSYRLEIFVVSSCLNCHDISLTRQNKNNRKFQLFLLSTPLQNAHHCHQKRCHQRISRIPDKAAPPPPPRYYFRSQKSTETGMILMHVWCGYQKSRKSLALYGTM